MQYNRLVDVESVAQDGEKSYRDICIADVSDGASNKPGGAPDEQKRAQDKSRGPQRGSRTRGLNRAWRDKKKKLFLRSCAMI